MSNIINNIFSISGNLEVEATWNEAQQRMKQALNHGIESHDVIPNVFFGLTDETSDYTRILGAPIASVPSDFNLERQCIFAESIPKPLFLFQDYLLAHLKTIDPLVRVYLEWVNESNPVERGVRIILDDRGTQRTFEANLDLDDLKQSHGEHSIYTVVNGPLSKKQKTAHPSEVLISIDDVRSLLNQKLISTTQAMNQAYPQHNLGKQPV